MTRDDILTGKLSELSPSNNPYDWLGPGTYFFEDDVQRAMIFALAAAAEPKKKLSRKPIASPAVLGAVLRVGNWLDMSTQRGIAEFNAGLEKIRQRATVPVNKKAFDGDEDLLLRSLDRAVFTEIHKMREAAPYDAVRSPFSQGEPLAKTCRFTKQAHVQIALLNKESIAGWFLPKGDRLMTVDEKRRGEAELNDLKAVLNVK